MAYNIGDKVWILDSNGQPFIKGVIEGPSEHFEGCYMVTFPNGAGFTLKPDQLKLRDEQPQGGISDQQTAER